VTAWSEAEPFGRTALVFTFKNSIERKISAGRAGAVLAEGGRGTPLFLFFFCREII